MKVEDLLKKRSVAVDAMTTLDASVEGRSMTKEENEKWSELSNEVTGIDAAILRSKKMEEQRLDVEAQPLEEQDNQAGEEKRSYDEAFREYFTRGAKATAKSLEILEQRAQSVGVEAGGGYTVPEGFSNTLTETMERFGGVRQIAEIVPTTTGATIPYPTMDETSNKGELLDENTAAAEQDIAFGSIPLSAYTYSSKGILVSNQLLQDSAFNLNAMVPRVAGERIGRITAEHFATGTGVSQPQGFVTGAAALAAGGAALTYDGLVDAIYSIDAAYRMSPKFAMVMNSKTLGEVRKLKDNENRPLISAPITATEPATILGVRYVIDEGLEDVGTGLAPIVIGDFSKFLIRDVANVNVMRSEHIYANKNQVAFFVFSRHDSRMIDASAFKKVVMA